MNWSAVLWFCLLVVFLIAEASTVTLVSLWFALGALAALIVSFFSLPPWVELLAFLVVSGASLAALRPVLRKYITPKLVKTNTDAVVGTTGLVTEEINNLEGTGQVKLGGMYWTARATSQQVIPENTIIRVDRIEGVKVFVSPAEVSANV